MRGTSRVMVCARRPILTCFAPRADTGSFAAAAECCNLHNVLAHVHAACIQHANVVFESGCSYVETRHLAVHLGLHLGLFLQRLGHHISHFVSAVRNSREGIVRSYPRPSLVFLSLCVTLSSVLSQEFLVQKLRTPSSKKEF